MCTDGERLGSEDRAIEIWGRVGGGGGFQRSPSFFAPRPLLSDNIFTDQSFRNVG